jgi:predicted dehydrogenase
MSVRSGDERPVSVGVVGLGYWGPNLTRVLSDAPDAELRWICDLDPQRLERFQRRYPAVRATSRIDDVLHDPDLDAVVLATPVFTHAGLAWASLRAGKHTFVEKPLATSSASATDLIELAGARGLTLMCGHTFLYSPAVRAVKRLIDEGRVGDIYFISSSRVNLGLHQRDISVIWDLGPHDFSILLYWLEEMPATVRAVGRDSIVRGIPDVAFVTLTFPSGVVCNVELSWLAPCKLRRTVIVGSEKMVLYDDCSTEPVRIFDNGVIYRDPQTYGEYHLSYRTGDIVSPRLDAREPLELELHDFVSAARSRCEADVHTELARDVVRISEAAERSLLSGGVTVRMDQTPRFRRERSGREPVSGTRAIA